MVRKYKGTREEYEQKLGRVMGRLGVRVYDYDWSRRGLLAAADGNVVVMLLPARTDTRWFHEYIYNKAEVRFIKGRLKFGGSKNAAPFPSMIVVFRFAPGQMETQNTREEKHEGVPEQARDHGGAMEKQMF